jgi:ADP-dependent NAD(P)H-hydrate dehydratase / NAD(P)H-hydrate epimerase
MKLFRSDQIKQIDEFTINEEPVPSIDLMERAAGQLLRWYLSRFERARRIFIFVGPGNNGGDGLALARLLDSNRYETEVYYVEFTENTSEDWKKNLARLQSETKVPITYLKESDQFPVISSGDVIIDAIFGSGLTRQVQGLAGDVIKYINRVGATVISVDIPSGMFGEDNSKNNYDTIISADYTLSLQFPKLAFMFSENAKKNGEWVVLSIGLSSNAIRNIISPYIFLGKDDIAHLLKKRNKFDHKGIFGHGLLVSGSSGKMGAAVLGAGASLRTGIGLITCHIPSGGVTIVQTCIPEAMVEPDRNERHFSEIGKTEAFSAVGIGPGIGADPETQMALYELLTECKKPMVIDADGLNILSLNKTWLSLVPAGTILTPHPKEFERLAGKSDNSFYRLERQIELSREYKCIIVLKGAHTSVTTPDGEVFFNSTGNPGMATAGSGDVLTGILLSLLAQGYTSENAAILGVYLHGLAGDIAAEESSFEAIIASDIIKCLGKAFNMIRESDT